MKKINASITAVGSFLPQTVLSNLDLEKIVDTNDEWITTRTGIKERRILDKGIGTSYMAINAAKAIIEEKEINPLEIDLVIVATITPDMHATATAAYRSLQNRGNKCIWLRYKRSLFRVSIWDVNCLSVYRIRQV